MFDCVLSRLTRPRGQMSTDSEKERPYEDWGTLVLTDLMGDHPKLKFEIELSKPVNSEAIEIFHVATIDKVVFYMSDGDTVMVW